MRTKKGLQKATALLLATIMILSAFAMIPSDLFKAKAADIESFDNRVEMDFNNNWKFYLGNESGAYAKAFDDSTWETVELPHDFSISQEFYSAGVEAESGNLPGGTGWYRKTFVMPATSRDKTVILTFDGAYKDTYVYVNGKLLGENHYGYNSFSFDISQYLNYDNKTANIIAVKVENQLPSSRWYSGSGIYRDVTMTVVDPVHVDLYGTYVTTPNLESSNGTDGTVNVKVTLDNDNGYDQAVTVGAQILDASGAVVATAASVDVTALAGQQTVATLTASLSNPNLWNSWDLGSPYLYTLRTTVTENGTVVDTYDTEFGYRWFKWNADTGFSLNGTNLKLEGVCMHHDQGALGSVQEYDAIYRQVAILKDMGCNTIRTSHGTPSRVFMDICNEMGMLVMDEFFDGWSAPKNSNSHDFGEYFNETINTSTNGILNAVNGQEWYKFVLTQSVKRDRNDPAVVIWDIGNELTEGASGDTSNYGDIAQTMKEMISNADTGLDPTRPVCQGNNGPSSASDIRNTVDTYMDVIGGNYNMGTWYSIMTAADGGTWYRESQSTKPYVSTETASALTTRGHYSTPYYHSVLTMTSGADSNFDINAYDTGKVSWGEVAASAWYYIIMNDWNSGEYVWTGFDYIGEPTPYNNTTGNNGSSYPSSSYFGIIDTAGFAKDTYYLYRSWWNEHSTTAHIVPGTWDASELYVDNSGYVDVAVYSNAAKIELLGDGNVIARATSDTIETAAGHKYQTWTETAVDTTNVNTTEFYTGNGKDFYPQFHVMHSAYSTISVKAYDESGAEITDTVGTKSVSNTTATKIVAETWSDVTYTADGDSYVYVELEAQDADGNPISTYNGTITATVNDDALTFVGVDNGDPVTTDKFQQASVFTGENTVEVEMFNGKALVVLRTNEIVDNDVSLSFTAENLSAPQGVTVAVAAEDENKGEDADEFEEVVVQPENLEYVPTQEDRHQILSDKLLGGGSNSLEADYTLYSAYPDGTTVTNMDIPDGWYIITGSDDQGGVSTGVLTHTAHANGGFVSDGSTGFPASTADAWYFEKVSTGSYYIYYTDDNGDNQYLTISNNQVYVSTAPYALSVTTDTSGNVTIGFGSTYINYDGGVSNRVNYWSTATNLNLYYVDSSNNNTTSTTTVTEVTSTGTLDGDYIITGRDDYTGTFAYGAMTYTEGSGGMIPENSSTIEANDNNVWTFEPTTGGYYIYYLDDSGSKVYLNIADGNISTSSTAAVLTVSDTDNDGKVVIGDSTNSYQLNYYGSQQLVGEWAPGTEITLYEVETTVTSSGGVSKWVPTASSELAPPVEDGEYVIYSNNYIAGGTSVTNTAGTYTGLERVAETPSSDVITALRANAYTFTRVDGTTNQYYITNSEGKYITMGSGNGTVTLSDSAVALNVYGTTDNRVVIYNGSYVFDNFQDANNMFSCWSGSTTSAGSNQIMTLYRNENFTGSADVPAGKVELYNALYEGVQHEPGSYSYASYEALLTALEDGWAVYEDENATEAQITAATNAINTAIAGLGIEYKHFPATLIKYGYNPDSSTPYNDGGAVFNTQTYESMKAKIYADDVVMAQIKTLIDYDNADAWSDDTEKDTALDAVVTAYSKIYSIAFTGAPVTGVTASSDFYKTAWNVWCKSDTQGANENTEEGASVQGLFSALTVDGIPVDHAPYNVTDEDGNTTGLPYGNDIDNANRSDFNTIDDGFSVSITKNGSSTSVQLPNLDGISVHINDMFKKEIVYANGTDASEGYSKYYWDMEFPFITATNEYGINTYVYSSSSDEYLFQAEFDDANKTANAVLTQLDEEWSVNRDSKGDGTGFFPFNYQTDATSLTGENAIYHYSMSFGTQFYIPVTGTYADGEDVIFSFSGDDDVLVYIDDVLVLDNGGLHGARSASINFTDASISYQYAMDVTESTVESTTENDVVYTYGATNADMNGDELAALQKLNEVRTDGEYHTFTFYYVERGSTDSNCEISFNLQQASEHVLLHDQTLVLDYGLPVEYYYVQSNDTITEEGKAATIEYLGLVDANVEVDSVVSFADPENLSKTFANDGDVLDVDGLKYGTAKMTHDGYITYKPSTLQMTGRDFFYFCASVENDPTYASGTTYYQYERINFVPATSIYFEDNFGAEISFIDGTTTDTNSTHGKWETVYNEGADAFADAQQAADLAGDAGANPYGFDPVYAGADETADYTQYSGFSAHKVTVSAANNAKNGGTTPTVEFTFTGTGFDVISLTDNTTGVFYMEIFDENGTRVGKRNVVDTYYGYAYGQLYADANGEATLEVTDIPLYKSAENEAVTSRATYYATDDTGATIVRLEPSYLDVSGVGYTDTPTYYDADGNLTTTETEDVAYAYAYAFGWIVADDVDGLYQIPVIKKTGLDYGTYRVVITPMYTAMFDNAGNGQFDLYVDAIRIYHPAEQDADNFIHQAYRDDDELYPHYLELKDILIGADSLTKDEATEGVIFIDGIAALKNDLEKYKLAGPNNELYLAAGQAVAFEIWASAIPDEVQLGVKSAKGTPKFSFSYEGNTAEKEIKTATEMNYILNSLLPTDGKLAWTRVVAEDGTTYYKTGTVVIQNAADDDSVLSITSMKWTFTGVGQYGHYETTLPESASEVSLVSTEETINMAYTAINAKNPAVDEDTDEDADDDAGAEIIPGDDNNTNDTNDEYQEELSWIQKIIKAITDFFKKLFGMA